MDQRERKEKELMTLIKLSEVDIKFINQKINLEKQIKKISLKTSLVGLASIILLCIINTLNPKALDVIDVISISAIIVIIFKQFEDVFSAQSNIRKLEIELSFKQEQIKEFNKQLEEI